MRRANVGGTERVLDAAVDAGVAANRVRVDRERRSGTRAARSSTRRTGGLAGTFVSAYDETKFLAHRAAEARIADGAAVVIAQPGVVYGPGDTSQFGDQVRQAQAGTLRYVSFPTLGFNAVHVDDVVAGLLLVHERGRLGESYVLGGELSRMRDARSRPPRGSPAAGRRA